MSVATKSVKYVFLVSLRSLKCNTNYVKNRSRMWHFKYHWNSSPFHPFYKLRMCQCCTLKERERVSTKWEERVIYLCAIAPSGAPENSVSLDSRQTSMSCRGGCLRESSAESEEGHLVLPRWVSRRPMWLCVVGVEYIEEKSENQVNHIFLDDYCQWLWIHF